MMEKLVVESRRIALKPDIPLEGHARVVVASGDARESKAVADQLREDRALTVETVSHWDALRALLDEFLFDVVIIGGSLSDLSGVQVNNHINSFYRDPPATILLGRSDVRAAIKAFRCGFADYLTEDMQSGQLLHDAVIRVARAVRDRREERAHLEYLERLAQRDGLTGLPNRHVIEERLEQLTHIKARYGNAFAIILLHFNEFEHICGSFGLKVGDSALVAFAKRLSGASRTADTVARLNDDTFIYLVDRDVTPEGIDGACRRLAAAMSFSLNLDDVGLSITADVGPALFPTDGATVAALIEVAESRFNTNWLAAAPSRAAGDAPVFAPVPTRNGAAGAAHAESESRNGAAGANGRAYAAGGEPAEMSEADRMKNRRRDLRRRTLKRGILILNHGYSTVNCVIRDMSDSGVRVAVEGRFLAPDHMELMIADTDRKRPVEKRWQRDNQLGLMFLDRDEAEKRTQAFA